ncbi:MAG: hypothetical protein IPP79_05425 [Chitinophagaceae bacterium]|nr:hypothetical protein [Chitinophagaceae bacterium]
MISEGIDVVGIGRAGNDFSIRISEYSSVEKLVNDLKAEYIFHLAPNSTTRHSAWQENHETISWTLNY